MSESVNATLFLDASTPLMQAGVLGSAGWLSLKQAEGDAISLLASLASSALNEAGLTPGRVRS
ncbi:MAG TPA: hypothetical protein PKI32_06115, partial [Opitutales bacterium]|nr:hypothetical protein [Opitutales bacterium]